MSLAPHERAARRAAKRRRAVERRRQAALLVCAGILLVVLVVSAAVGRLGSGMRSADAATSSSGALAATAPATDTNPSARVTVAAVGDTMMGSPPYGLPPDHGRQLFSAVKKYLVGNVVIVDQEGTLTETGPSKCGPSSSDCYAFRSPPSYASNLTAAGFTVANLADNHTYDFGAVGLGNTVAALKRVGLPHTGLPSQFAIQHVGSVSIAILGFAPYNWCADSLNLAAVRALVKKARHEAELVIVYFHAGAQGADALHVGPGDEYVDGNPQGNVQQLAHTAVDAGADLVIGTGPHVLRGIQFYHGHMIAYSMGNFVGYKGFGLGGTLSTSGVLQATLTASGRLLSARLRPVELNSVGVPYPGGEGIPLVRTLSKEDFRASAARISESGVITPPAE
jgi:hypothetical protein